MFPPLRSTLSMSKQSPGGRSLVPDSLRSRRPLLKTSTDSSTTSVRGHKVCKNTYGFGWTIVPSWPGGCDPESMTHAADVQLTGALACVVILFIRPSDCTNASQIRLDSAMDPLPVHHPRRNPAIRRPLDVYTSLHDTPPKRCRI